MTRDSSLEHDELRDAYTQRFSEVLIKLASNLEKQLYEYMGDQERVDRIAARAKGIDRFLAKARSCVDGKLRYTDPLSEIQDQIAARIIVFYKQDVECIEKIVKKYYTAIEDKPVLPESEFEFGYFGHHLILVLPSDVIEGDMVRSLVPQFFELQIKTLFQHAWSEAYHDLGYKPTGVSLSSDQKRQMAFTSAQAWGADRIFDELYRELGSK